MLSAKTVIDTEFYKRNFELIKNKFFLWILKKQFIYKSRLPKHFEFSLDF